MNPGGPLSAIVWFSLRFRGVVIALAIALVGYGVYALSGAKYDVFPEFAPPRVTIQCEAPGLSPEQVESLVTQPIENEVNGVPDIESLRSSSIQGLSLVTVTFRSNSDIHRARQTVAERLATLNGQLPQGVRAPNMTPLTSSTSVVLSIGLTSDERSLMDLRTLADWTMKPRLLVVPGVAKVSVFGGEVKQYQIQIIPERLVFYQLAFGDVLQAAQRATGVIGAGFIENENQRIILQTQAKASTTKELARTVITQSQGVNVTLGDIAHIAQGPEPPFGAASVMGKPGVILLVSSQYGANTYEITTHLEQALNDLRPAIEKQKAQLHSDLFRPANFIQTSLSNITFSLILGGVLVVVVLFLFLADFRSAAISCTPIPLSLLAAVIILEQFGFTLNTITLGGLAVAIGVVVDDAVITVENILRRLRENRRVPDPLPAIRVVLAASLEVRSAVVYATFAVILVFVPVLTMSGLAGRLFAPLGVAYITANLASLLVALTVTPALCLAFLGGKKVSRDVSPFVRWLKSGYERILRKIERRSWSVVSAVSLLTAAGLLTLFFVRGGFLPDLREGHFIVHMSAIPGTSLGESLSLGRQVATALEKLPSVRKVSQRVGRAEAADDVWGTQYSEFDVDLKSLNGAETARAFADIRKVLTDVPGVTTAVKPFLTERVEETLSGYTASVAINIFGDDLDALDENAAKSASLVKTMPGATDVQIQSPPGAPDLLIRARPEALQRWGFTSIEFLEAVRAAYQGVAASQVYEGNRVYDVAVTLDPASKRSIDQVKTLMLRSSAGTYVPLGVLAYIEQESGRYVVLHQGARRVQTITCNVTGRDTAAFVADARRLLASKIQLPSGSYMQFSGTSEEQTRSRQDLLLHSSLAGLGIILLLSIVLANGRNLALILANLPFALVGGVGAVFAIGGSLSVGAMVGFVTLFGITVRNSIMMISHYEHLVTTEGQEWNLNTAIRGASERLTPICMTALVTALGLLPLALGSGEPGREIEGPMAIIILGGLLTSTALNLLVLPTLALRYGRFSASATNR
jgi:CzcA family heavy metal efflux pump